MLLFSPLSAFILSFFYYTAPLCNGSGGDGGGGGGGAKSVNVHEELARAAVCESVRVCERESYCSLTHISSSVYSCICLQIVSSKMRACEQRLSRDGVGR